MPASNAILPYEGYVFERQMVECYLVYSQSEQEIWLSHSSVIHLRLHQQSSLQILNCSCEICLCG